MITKAVILCGGLGTRFLPISKSIPKEMLPAINKPIIQYVVEEIAGAGIKDILIVVGRGKESIIDHFDKNIELEERLKQTKSIKALGELDKLSALANLHFIRQIEPKGTGHAVLCARSFVGEDPFLLHYGDEVFVGEPSRTQQLIKAFNSCGASVLAAKEVEKSQVNRYGIIRPVINEINSESVSVESGGSNNIREGECARIAEIVEKPEIKKAPSNLAYIGSAVLESSIFEHIIIRDGGEEQGIIDSFNTLAGKNSLYAANIKGIRFDVGTPKGLIEVNNFLAKNAVPPII